MMKLSNILAKPKLNEFNKSQMDHIAAKLSTDRNGEFMTIMNRLKAVGVSYVDIKSKIQSGEISNVKSLEALATSSKSNKRLASKSDIKQPKGSKKIYSDDRFTVFKIDTAKASCELGSGTKWCISGTSGARYFDEYVNYDGKSFYFIFDVDPPESKYKKVAAAVFADGSIVYWDGQDNPHKTVIDSEYKKFVSKLKPGVDMTAFKGIISPIGKLNPNHHAISEKGDAVYIDTTSFVGIGSSNIILPTKLIASKDKIVFSGLTTDVKQWPKILDMAACNDYIAFNDCNLRNVNMNGWKFPKKLRFLMIDMQTTNILKHVKGTHIKRVYIAGAKNFDLPSNLNIDEVAFVGIGVLVLAALKIKYAGKYRIVRN